MSETERYRKQGYLHLKRLFPDEVLRAFYRRMESDLKAAGRPLGKHVTQGPLLLRPSLEVYAYHYTPMLTFLWGMTPRVEQAAGCTLLPTYAYFRIYQGGDICRVHSDRPACEHSVSLTMIYSDDKQWPLSVATERNEDREPMEDGFGDHPYTSIAMEAGDGVLYQGTHHRHGRVAPNPNAWSAHLFMHWVEKEGRYKDHAFDLPTIRQNGLAA